MDVAGTPLSVSFELDTTATPGTLGETYTKAGFRWDYDAMEKTSPGEAEGVGVTPPIRTLVLIDAFRMGGAETLLAPMIAASRGSDIVMDVVSVSPEEFNSRRR